jgi:XTP/dITP diphosphohydrolase
MFENLFRGKTIDLVFLDTLGLAIKAPEENGKTPEENALIKARYYCLRTGLPTLADDAGFCVDALNGEPGVMARRWGGQLPDTISDEDWLDFYMERVALIPNPIFKGSFPFSRALAFPDGRTFVQNGKIEILLSKTPKRPFKAGFPVSSVHVFPDGRHSLEVPHDDPAWEGHNKKEELIAMLKRAGLIGE